MKCDGFLYCYLASPAGLVKRLHRFGGPPVQMTDALQTAIDADIAHHNDKVNQP